MKFVIQAIFKTLIVPVIAIFAYVHYVNAQTILASILPPAKTTFFDANGKPLSGGKVFFYIPNTTTQKNTWQDTAETVLNPNPVILDSAGRAIIFGSGLYRQQVFDKNNNLIWDQITLSAGGGSSSGTATGDGDLVGTIKPWAGMTAPNQYVFTYGQEVSRALFPALFTAITSTQAVFCNSGSPVLQGLTDTTNFWIGMTLEVSCLGAGNSTIISKTATTITMAANANVTINTNATFFPWGRGNGTTTFNLPDLRGYVLAGNDNMGGTAANILTTANFGSQTPDAAGAAGGSQTVAITLTTANLPPYTPTATNQFLTGASAVGVQATGTATGVSGGGTLVTPTLNPQGGTDTPFNVNKIQPTRTTNYIIKITPDTNSTQASGVTSLGGMTGDIACGTGLLCTGNNISVSIGIANIGGLGTGIATALGNSVNTAGAPVLFNGALGTPSSGTLTNATGLPVTTGISGLGTGVATALTNNVNSLGGIATVGNVVTSITPAGGIVSSNAANCSQTAITTTGTLYRGDCINAQSGASYAIQDSDRGKIITATNAGAQAYSIAQASTAGAFFSGWTTFIENNSTNAAGIITITPTTSQICAQGTCTTTYKILPGQFARITSDGTNYQVTENGITIPSTTASLGSDTAISNAGYTAGPTLSQGSAGTWFASGTVTFLDTGAAVQVSCKLWDGTTVISSARAATSGANVNQTIALSGTLASPAAGIAIACTSNAAGATTTFKFNTSGNSKDCTLTALRIQ